MRVGLLLLIALTSGCIPYPVYKTLQPSSEVFVRDPELRPIEGATVQLIANSYPYNREKTRVTALTDSQGRAQFDAVKEWRIEAIMLHGAEFFYWNWCIAKEGFNTFSTANSGGEDPPDTLKIMLQRGESSECPKYGF